MPFDIYQLNGLDYDDVEPIFEDYINGAVTEFLNSPAGRKLLDNDPNAGNWIASFIDMAYMYGEVTLPKMTKTDAQNVMEYVLPRKLVLMEPSQADPAVPELVAYWKFLKEKYNFRSANAIAKYLQSLGDRFRDLMTDRSRGSFVKSFLMQGMEAGFDMNTPEGLEAFQAIYNQQMQNSQVVNTSASTLEHDVDDEDSEDLEEEEIQNDAAPHPQSQDLPETLLHLEGIQGSGRMTAMEQPPLGEESEIASMQNLFFYILDNSDLETKLIDAAQELLPIDNPAIAKILVHTLFDEMLEMMEMMELEEDLEDSEIDAEAEEFLANIQAAMTSGNDVISVLEEQLVSLLKSAAGEFSEETLDELKGLTTVVEIVLSEEQAECLTRQTFSNTEPGTILNDFQTVLDIIISRGKKGIPVSDKLKHFSQKDLIAIDEALGIPFPQDLKRPVMKSFPHISGIYLLLRASGLAEITRVGKKYYLRLNDQVFESWQQLNPTEKYFSLLEAWFLRSREELLGEQTSIFTEGSKCFQYFTRSLAQGQQSVRNYEEQHHLNFLPGSHNMALFHLFGLVEIDAKKPHKGKGWRYSSVTKTPFGDALVSAMSQVYGFEDGTMQTNPQDTNFDSIALGQWQPSLSVYFPDWQQSLASPEIGFRSGVYTFRVSLGKIWRRIAISADYTLYDLSLTILESVDFDNDHLDQFSFENPFGITQIIPHPQWGPEAISPFSTNAIHTFFKMSGNLSTAEFLIGHLPIKVGAVMEYLFDFGDNWEFEVLLESVDEEDEREEYAEIIESKGKAPEQYPD